MMDIFAELEKLRQSHRECSDIFYACPKSKGGAEYRALAGIELSDSSGYECDCGADEHNHRLVSVIVELKRRGISTCDSSRVVAEIAVPATIGHPHRIFARRHADGTLWDAKGKQLVSGSNCLVAGCHGSLWSHPEGSGVLKCDVCGLIL